MVFARDAAASRAARPAEASRRRLPRVGPGAELERLQRSAGNAAVGTLMRQPHDKTALEGAGVSGSTRVDGKTAGLVNTVLAASPLLAPYIKGKLPKEGILGSKVEIHDSDAEFEGVYVRVNKLKDSLANKDVQKTISQVGGFFDRATGTTHLRKRSDFGDALHEALHKLSATGIQNFFGDFLNEGITAYLTDQVLAEQRQPEHKDLYRENAACAARVVGATSFDTVAQSYFENKNLLLDALLAKLKVDPPALRKLAKDSSLCDKLPK
jgi:hypothetical protein